MIGDNIKFYRKKNQLTQDDIAKECSVTRQALLYQNRKSKSVSQMSTISLRVNLCA